MSSFHWTEQSEKAAQLIALGDFTLAEIAAQAGVSRSTLFEWRRHENFIARVDEHLVEIRAEVRRIGLATVEARVSALNDRWNRMRRVIEARAADVSMQDVPGGPTGLMVRSIKRVVVEDDTDDEGRKTKTSREVEEYAVDTSLLKEMREHEKQAAQELGQWAEKREVSGPNGGPVQVQFYMPSNGRDPIVPPATGPSGNLA